MAKPSPAAIDFFRRVHGQTEITPTGFGALLDPAKDAIEAAILRTTELKFAFGRLPKHERRETEEINQKITALLDRLNRLSTQVDKVDDTMEEIESEHPRIAAVLGIAEEELDG